MTEKHHNLHHEFPEYRDQIIRLKQANGHFYKLTEQYDALTHEIEKEEHGGSAHSDAHMEELKKNRLALKDQIFRTLQTG